MSAIKSSPKKINSILKKHRRWDPDKSSPSTTPSERPRAFFSETISLRQHSVHDKDGNKIEGSEVYSEEGLGPEGKVKNAEEKEASNKQRDIDYVFVYTLFNFYNKEMEQMIDSNINKYGRERAIKELKRNREAYMPTRADILEKCVWVLGELKKTVKIDIKGGSATLTIGQNDVPVEWVVKMKNYLQSQEYRDYWNK